MKETMEDKIKKLLADQDLSEMEAEVLDTLVPCLMIETTEEEVPTGASKFGGTPDLPSDMIWPAVDGKPLAFVAQYNLREIHGVDKMNPLPDRGMLYFFLAADELLWGAPVNSLASKVLYADTEPMDLQPRAFPDDLPREVCHPENGIRFRFEKTLPDVEAPEEMDALWFDLMDQLYELEDRKSGHHQAFGQPLALEEDVFQSCRVRSEKESNEWILLLQVDSDGEAERVWGSFGMLYFCITREDLLKGSFGEACLVIQQ